MESKFRKIMSSVNFHGHCGIVFGWIFCYEFFLVYTLSCVVMFMITDKFGIDEVINHVLTF